MYIGYDYRYHHILYIGADCRNDGYRQKCAWDSKKHIHYSHYEIVQTLAAIARQCAQHTADYSRKEYSSHCNGQRYPCAEYYSSQYITTYLIGTQQVLRGRRIEPHRRILLHRHGFVIEKHIRKRCRKQYHQEHHKPDHSHLVLP